MDRLNFVIQFGRLSKAVGLAMIVCVLGGVGCSKEKAPAVTTDPQSADAIMLHLQEHGQLLNEALARKDYKYIYDYADYFASVARALVLKLSDEEKQRMGGTINKLIGTALQLDSPKVGEPSHIGTTTANMQSLQEGLKELDTQFKAGKK